MIRAFRDKETEKTWNQEFPKIIPANLYKIALRKLFMLNRANSLNDLKIPPSNKLEKLLGKRKNQYSIRINEKYRICFYWKNIDASLVEIVDYH